MLNTKFKQTEIGEIPDDWGIKKLDEVTNYINRGAPPLYTEEERTIVLNQKCIRDGQVNLDESRFTNDEIKKITEEKYLQKNDILINSTGQGTLGRVGQIHKINKPITVDSHVTIVRPIDSIINPIFLGYVLKSRQKQIEDFAEGSTGQTELSRDKVKSLIIPYPSIEEQKQIASILSFLDDKIELSKKSIKTLEEIGQTLFKRWFVDFEFPNEKGEPYKSSGGEMVDSELGEIPKIWSVKKVSDTDIIITDFVANGSFASLKENVSIKDEIDYALFLRNTDLKNDFSTTRKYVDKHAYEFLKKTKMFGGEVIISSVGDVGSVFLCPDFSIPMTLGNNVIALKSDFNNFYYFLFKSPLGQDLIQSITAGSVQMKFNKTDFRNIQLIYPNKKILEKFTETVDLLIKQISSIKKEMVYLVDLKNSLLPKLLSGKIRVD